MPDWTLLVTTLGSVLSLCAMSVHNNYMTLDKKIKKTGTKFTSSTISERPH